MTNPLGSYAGIGSRQTPDDVCRTMFASARRLAHLGYILRSGGAIGADKAFEAGVDAIIASNRALNFSHRFKEIYRATDMVAAMELAAKFHPAWSSCSEFAKKLHARNGQIMLGKSLDDPVDFVLCWTPGGRLSGGTAQAMRIAIAYGIPIFNLALPGTLNDLAGFLKSGRPVE